MKLDLEPRYEDVLLVVSELMSNSVRRSESTEIDLKVEAQDGQIRIEVSDDGPGFTHETPRGEGMGLTIVEKLSERWGLVSGVRFTVWAELTKGV